MKRRMTIAVALLALAFGTAAAETLEGIPGRDIRGPAADPRNFPSVVALYIGRPPETICSGVIISDRAVLTAAHCVDGVFREPEYSVPFAVLAFHGWRRETSYIDQLAMHPDYSPLSYAGRIHDIAILRLETMFRSRGVAAATMPSKLDSAHIQQGREAIAAGWAGDELRYGRVYLEACDDAADLDESICAEGVLQGGDSGGPLFITRNGAPVLAGLNAAGSRHVSRFVRVDNYTDWIRETQASWPKPGDTVYGTKACQLSIDGDAATLTVNGTPIVIRRGTRTVPR